MDPQQNPGPQTDPGWLRAIPGPFLPHKKAADGLLAFRSVYLSLFYAGFLILYVLLFIDPGMGRVSLPVAAGLAVLGLAGIASAHWSTRRPLPTDSPGHLARSYHQNFFIGFALNEIPLLLSFVLVFMRFELWPYLLALPFWVMGMLLLAPGRRNLTRRQQEITNQGSTLDLVSAIRKGPVAQRFLR